MKIPDKLKGKEVKKFEDEFTKFMETLEKESEQWRNKLSGLEDVWYKLGKFCEVSDFLDQDFTPDMIEEYFEEWEYEGYKLPDAEIRIHDKDIILRIFENYATGLTKTSFSIELGWQIKTLSDFVNACLNSGIKLKWRE